MATELNKETAATGGSQYQDTDDFSAILKQSFKPRSERAASEVEKTRPRATTRARTPT